MMNKEEQRIAIAEACGWKDCHESENWAATIGTLHEVNGNQYALLADYLNDLNAMHEAEKMLDITKVEEYCSTFVRIVRHSLGIDDYESIYPTRFAVYATAAQRAEAFLKTIDKWTTNQNEL